MSVSYVTRWIHAVLEIGLDFLRPETSGPCCGRISASSVNSATQAGEIVAGEGLLPGPGDAGGQRAAAGAAGIAATHKIARRNSGAGLHRTPPGPRTKVNNTDRRELSPLDARWLLSHSATELKYATATKATSAAASSADRLSASPAGTPGRAPMRCRYASTFGLPEMSRGHEGAHRRQREQHDDVRGREFGAGEIGRFAEPLPRPSSRSARSARARCACAAFRPGSA